MCHNSEGRGQNQDTRTLFVLQHQKKHVFSGLATDCLFLPSAQTESLSLVVFRFRDKSPHGMVEWWQCCLCLTEYTVCFCVCERLEGNELMEAEKKRQGRRDGAGCTRRKLGLMLLHAAAPKHPHSSCWSVCLLFVYRFSVLRPHEERGTCIVSTVLVLTYSFEWIYVAICKCGVDHASGLVFLLSISEEAK